MNTISGLLRPIKGKILFEDAQLDKTSPDKIVRMGVCQVPEGRRIFAGMTVLENLMMGFHTIKNKTSFSASLERVYEYFPRLKERAKQSGGTLSGANSKCLLLAGR